MCFAGAVIGRPKMKTVQREGSSWSYELPAAKGTERQDATSSKELARHFFTELASDWVVCLIFVYNPKRSRSVGRPSQPQAERILSRCDGRDRGFDEEPRSS